MSRTLVLNCLILGEDRGHIFQLKIPRIKTVSDLKEAITDKKEAAFRYVGADDLELWNFCIPINENFEEVINKLKLYERNDSLLSIRKLSVFSGQFADEHLHIVIRSPLLNLNCLVCREDRSHIFSLEIPRAKTVGALREAIKDKKQPAFNHVVADTLILWRVSIPDDDTVIESLPGASYSRARTYLNPPRPYLPSQPLFSTASKFDEPTKKLTGIARLEAADGIKALNAPLFSMNYSIPIQLYHPSFAKFLRNIRGDTVDIDVKPKEHSATHSLFYFSAMSHQNEARRVEVTKMLLEDAIGHQISAVEIPVNESGMKADGACMIVNCGGGLSALAADNRVENVGTGGRDPLKRCTTFFRSYYARGGMRPIRDHCCCPTYLIALAGSWICILGAVFVDDVVVQPLTDFIWLGGYPCSDDRLQSMTRILASLGAGIAELRQFYTNLSLHDSQEDPQRFYPFIRQYTVGGQVVKFSYQDYLTQKTPEHAKAMFLATTETEDGREPRRQIVVKFVQRYNADAHRLLATAGLAPKKFYSPTEHPDLAGLTMVAMEFVDGKPAHQHCGSLQLPPSISDQLKKPLEILHENNFVFGDFRHPNIMITKDGRVRLIDFDWCGVHGEAPTQS
ncbi:hypothetical protein EDB83DRAFT_2520665 [Lactarius deliciosus]|nr:hypothetical protein EDB83DRAFT_2520665 [Lactarius deliciosus]